MRKDFEDFINIVKSVVLKQEVAIANVDIDFQFRLAEAHNMTVILSEYIRQFPQENEQITTAVEHQRDLLTYKYISQNKSYEKLIRNLAYNHIRYMPVKGITISGLYPMPLMREMSDVDILVDTENLSLVKQILTDSGFLYEHKGHHDVYRKYPGLCYEIHRTLIDEKRDTGFDDLFADAWSKAERDGYEYRLMPENEYIYLMAHLYGHFHQGGIGVRSVLDLFLLKNHTELNTAYIDQVFESYGLKKFSDNIQHLSEVWFCGKKMDKLTDELGEYIVTSGAYGKTCRLNLDLSDENRGNVENTVKIIRRKLLLNKDEIKSRYPWAKNKLLIIFAYVVRVGKILLHNGKEIGSWVKEFTAGDKEKVRLHKEKMKRFGVKGD